MSLVLHDNQDGDDDNGLMQRNGPDRTVTTIKVLPINSSGGLSKFVKSHCTLRKCYYIKKERVFYKALLHKETSTMTYS